MVAKIQYVKTLHAFLLGQAESGDIAVYLDKKFPDPPLGCDGGAGPAAVAATSGFFPALAKMFVDSGQLDPALESDLLKTIESMETYLGGKPATEGDFLLGKKISLVDCSVAPKLYHLDVVLENFFPGTHGKIFHGSDFERVKKYVETMFGHPAFKQTKYAPEIVVWGWESHAAAAKNK